MLAVASRLCGLHARIMSSTGGQCSMRLWHAALSTSRRYLRPAVWQKYFGITIEELDRLTEAVAAALDGCVMTREELVQEVRRLTGSAAFGAKVAESSWGTLLKPTALTGRRLDFACPAGRVDLHLCFTPREAVSKDQWPARVVPESRQPASP